LFASPLNHCLDNYYSVFEIDKLFGSKGNSLKKTHLSGGFEVNPPFIEETMEKTASMLINSLKKSTKENQF
jgi:phosphorylated CTD-interacting factor 1